MKMLQNISQVLSFRVQTLAKYANVDFWIVTPCSDLEDNKVLGNHALCTLKMERA